MPKIQVRGFPPESATARVIKQELIGVAQALGLGDDAIAEPVWSDPTSCDGQNQPMPYLVVASSEFEEIGPIINAIKETGTCARYGLDLEWTLIGGFFTAGEMSASNPPLVVERPKTVLG